MYCKKGMAILLTAVCLCMSFSVSTSAETNDSFITDEVSPAYEIGSNPTSNLSVSGKTAYCTSVVGGKKAVSITVDYERSSLDYGLFRIIADDKAIP